MAARLVNRKRLGIRGRTDLGVEANRTGVYQVEKTEEDRNGVIVSRKRHTVYRLRRITDGFCIDAEAGTVGEGGAPDSNRQRLERLLSKTVMVEDGGQERLLPFVFLDQPPPAQFARVGRYPVPVADDKVREVMHDLCDARDDRIQGTQRDWQKQKREAEADDERARVKAEKRAEGRAVTPKVKRTRGTKGAVAPTEAQA